ncbi:nuclear transport factor 2 family protein [Halobacteria archaeon HArc-gm2]|nr:nuclear transport factor 2 family protein [Halobacteria archaeon HArc-gm2]
MSDDAVGTESSARETVRAYYDALRNGDPLGPFFADDEDLVKFGISERLVGGEAVADGLREQTETTSGWTVDSRALRVTERDDHAWFSDEVFVGWTGSDPPIRFEFETRWSGTLERRGGADDPAVDGDWRVVGMHVSTAGDI